MGIFNGIIGTEQEQRTQLYFHDDGSFQFRKLPFEDACLVQKKDNVVVKAWRHFYSSEIPFEGYKGIHADMVTLSFGRDFILDPFNKVPETKTPNGGKPKKTESEIKNWTAEVAESQRYKVMNKPGTMQIWDKVALFLGSGLIIELLILGIKIGLK